MEIPKCCGKNMKMGIETSKFIETECDVCGDVVFVKKDSIQKPQMLDD